MMKSIPVTPVALPLFWPKIEAWVSRALSRAKADISIHDVKQLLSNGGMQLWLAQDNALRGCCITEITGSVRGKRCNLVIIAGEQFDSWGYLESDIAAWARAHGCNRLTLQGRMGWKRKLVRSGWRPSAILLEKPIPVE